MENNQPNENLVAGPPVLSRDEKHLPAEMLRGSQIPETLDPLADGILMQHQKDWLEDDSDMKIASKGRRTGITFTEGLDATLLASAKPSAGGTNYFYVGDTKDKGREFIGYVAHFAKVVSKQLAVIEEFMFEDEQPDGSTKYISAFRVKFSSGFRVEALSSNPANIRGLQGVVCIDEAAYHNDVREVIDAVNALLIWGGKVRVISTHNGVLNPFNELINEAIAGTNGFVVHHIPFSLAVENGLYRRVCLVLGIEWTQVGEDEWEAKIRRSYGTRKAAMKQELDAIPAESEGAALTSVQIEACMVQDIPRVVYKRDDEFKSRPKFLRDVDALAFCARHLLPILKTLDPKRSHIFGSDFARSGDVSGTDFKAIGVDLKRRTVFALEMSNIPFETQKLVLHYCLDRLPRLQAGAMDASGNGAYLAEVTAQKYGTKILEVKFSQEWYRVEMPHYINAFSEGTLEIIKHVDIKRDHQALQVVGGITKVPQGFTYKGEDGRKRHGDMAIAGALAWFASRSEVKVYGHEKVEKPMTNLDRGFIGSGAEGDDGAFSMRSTRSNRGIF